MSKSGLISMWSRQYIIRAVLCIRNQLMFFNSGMDEVYADLQNFATPDMVKEHYEALTDKEKAE